MIKQLSVITAFFIFSSTSQAFDQKCFDRAVSRFNHCSRNAHDKASRGNFTTLRRRTCENELLNKAGECFGSREITSCERRAGDFFINCQSRENQKFIRGNIGARHVQRCMGKFQEQMLRCEEEEVKAAKNQGASTENEGNENTLPATPDKPVAQSGQADTKTATTTTAASEVDRRLVDE